MYFMGLSHLLLAIRDHLMLCETTLILGMMRWVFAGAVRFPKEVNVGLFFPLFVSDNVKEYTPSSDFSLEIVRDHLISTTFGDSNTAKRLPERESCEMQCAVCLKRLRNSDEVWELSNCSHVFHRQCLERWLFYDARMTCPLCRASLINLNQETTIPSSSASPASLSQPSWAVEQLLYFFGDDLLRSSSYALS